MLKKLFIVGCLFVTSSCSSGGGDSKGKVQTFYFNNKVTATQVFNESRISCEGECPEYIGGMTAFNEYYDTYGVSVCSLTHIGQNRVILNRHCLPDDLDGRKNVSCFNKIKMKFPATGSFKEESLDCDRIIDFSSHPADGDNVINPDWAVMSFRGSLQRKPAPIEASEGLQHGSPIIAYPIFYTLNDVPDVITVQGIARKVTCTLNRQVGLEQMYFSDFSAMYAATDCTREVIKGNSGSGIFNSAGNLAGVLSYLSKNKSMGGTNGACIPYLRAEPLHDACGFSEDSKFKNALMELAFMKRALDFNDNFTDSNPSYRLEKTIYLEGEDQQIEISEMQYVPSEDRKLTPGIEMLWRQEIVKFLFKDKVKCIDSQKAATQPHIHLPVRSVVTSKSDAPFLSWQTRPTKFQLSKDGANYIATLDASMYPHAKQKADELVHLDEKCVESKSAILGQFYTQCEELEASLEKLQTESVDKQAEVFARFFLADADATSIKLSIPACE